MIGLGTLVNVAAILGGSMLGLVLKRGFPKRWQETILQGVGLCILVIGLQMALQSKQIILVIVSIVLGTAVGEALDIDNYLTRFGNWVEAKVARHKQSSTPAGSIGEGFIAASLIYCIGAMAIVGSIQDGLVGDHQILYAKSTLDGITAVIFTANLGIGVALSALSVLLYQGSLTILAVYMQSFMTPEIMTELTAAGGVLIMAIACNMIKIMTVRIANQIPALLVVVILAKIFL
jgi:uncharacterized membrane protein YqgA involved in biofilm formation